MSLRGSSDSNEGLSLAVCLVLSPTFYIGSRCCSFFFFSPSCLSRLVANNCKQRAEEEQPLFSTPPPPPPVFITGEDAPTTSLGLDSEIDKRKHVWDQRTPVCPARHRLSHPRYVSALTCLRCWSVCPWPCCCCCCCCICHNPIWYLIHSHVHFPLHRCMKYVYFIENTSY